MDLKQQYNEVAEKQRYFFNLIKSKCDEFNQIQRNEFEKQEFEQNLYGLTHDEFDLMQQTKELAKEITDKLLASGIKITAKEILKGFEVNL